TEKSRFSNRLYISILDRRTIEDRRSICKIGVRSEPRWGCVAQSAFVKLSPRCNEGIVSVLSLNNTAYNWQTTTFNRPDALDLVIYELHVRDFLDQRNYKTLRDSISYLKRLGVNAVELMPVQEFEANSSWGYNPSFHFALDKYYGTTNELKAFIDECHQEGIAVILDMVLNHAFGQSPMVRLYQQSGSLTNNPWFNITPTHPYNVG